MSTWTDLGDGVRIRRSRVFAMNSVLLRSGRHAVLVDPGVLPSDLDDLAVAARDAEVVLVFTHAHWDHVLGRSRWPEARTVGHARLAEELRRDGPAILADAVDLGMATDAEQAAYTAWRQYRVLISRLDLTQQPIAWPPKPATAS